MRAYLWERRRFIKAASALPAREVGDMISFLASDDEAKAKLFEAIPNLCFAAVSEIVAQYGEDPACRAAVGNYMKEPKAPPVLTTLLVGRYEQFIGWSELPSLITLLTHAIALGEGHQGGETLKMQNIVRRLFSDKKWLEKIFGWLDEQDQALLFERFQASIAWDPSTHHTTVVRMTNIIPSLKGRLVKVEKKREMARITSPRSFALRKAEYLKLINEDMPANVKRIEFAKSYGDLSENAEYQYAKDEQRVLMQKQAQMQSELESVKAGDFAQATTDEVMPGVTVVCATPDGEKVWTILGEWDNDFDLGVISSKALVAQHLIGKKPGDQFELPDAEGGVKTATVVEIRPLSDEIRSWMQIPEGLEI
jgi:transcription elongation factor GreA